MVMQDKALNYENAVIEFNSHQTGISDRVGNQKMFDPKYCRSKNEGLFTQHTDALQKPYRRHSK